MNREIAGRLVNQVGRSLKNELAGYNWVGIIMQVIFSIVGTVGVVWLAGDEVDRPVTFLTFVAIMALTQANRKAEPPVYNPRRYSPRVYGRE